MPILCKKKKREVKFSSAKAKKLGLFAEVVQFVLFIITIIVINI